VAWSNNVTKSDYELVAGVFKNSLLTFAPPGFESDKQALRILAYEMVDAFTTADATFDKEQFLRFCNIEEIK
jgi:hypothetical protein